MSAQRRLGTVAAVVAGLLCTGCSPVVNEELTLAAAKSETQRVENVLVQALPAEVVATVSQHPKGSLLSCANGEGSVWAGGTDVTLTGHPDVDPLMDAVTTAASAAGMTTRREVLEGTPVLSVRGAFGALWSLRFEMNRDAIDLNSFSECFRLPVNAWRDADL